MPSTDLLIIAGEPSGDMHATKLVQELRQSQPTLQITAMGGEQLAAAGANIIVDCKELAVVGAVEILKVWRQIRNAFQKIKSHILEDKPKTVILVDYPGFNIRMAKFAKQHDCRVIYYISPQVWAWNQRRVHKLKKWVDVMAVIFPFEVTFFKQFNIAAKFVGHPLAEKPLCPFSTEEAKQTLNLSLNNPVIALIPGSRNSEVLTLIPALLDAAKQLHSTHPSLQFVLPKANSIDSNWLNEQLATCPVPIKVTTEDRYTTMQAADIAIAASGTVTLELALLEKPMIIIYKTNPITFWLGKKVIKLKFLGLPNIIAEKSIVPELLQSEMTAENIAKHTQELLSNSALYTAQKNALSQIHYHLKDEESKTSLSNLIIKTINTHKEGGESKLNDN